MSVGLEPKRPMPVARVYWIDVPPSPTGAPPRVNYPVAVACEPAGAVYVAVDEQGSLGRTPGGGKILRCVDKDGDGKADDVTVFAKVDHPLDPESDQETVRRRSSTPVERRAAKDQSPSHGPAVRRAVSADVPEVEDHLKPEWSPMKRTWRSATWRG